MSDVAEFMMRGRSYAWLCLTLLAVEAGGWCGTARAEGLTRESIAIRTPPPEAPVETAGTGLGPEVSVRIKVDTRGHVTGVEVLSIRPSSEYDALFRSTAEQALRAWRYAPQLVDGQPVESALEWTVQFPPRESAPRDAPSAIRPAPSVYRSVEPESSGIDLQRKLSALGSEQRALHLERQGTLARQHFRVPEPTRSSSPRVIAYTDAPEPEIARVAARHLEAAFGILDQMLARDVPPQPEPYKILAFVYASRDSFTKLRDELMGLEWAEGFYYPAGLIAFHLQMPSNESLVSMLLHEATHAYLDRYVSRPGVVLPRWLHEGLAEYIGNSEIQNKELIPGRVRKSEVYRTPWASVRGRAASRYSVAELKGAVKRGEAIRLQSLVGAGPEDFSGDQRRMYYTMAWILVHFLRHGEASWADERFSPLVLYLAEGYPPLEAFRQVYGEPAKLEPAFVEYVKRF